MSNYEGQYEEQEPTGGPVRFIILEAVRSVDPDQAALAMCKLVEVAGGLLVLSGFRFVMSAGGGAPIVAGFEVQGFDDGSAATFGQDLRDILETTSPWLSLSDVVNLAPWGDLPPAAFALVPDYPLRPTLRTTRSVLWPVAARAADMWAIDVSVDGPLNHKDSEQQAALGRILLRGTGARQDFMAELLAGDIGGEVQMRPVPIAGTRLLQPIELPLSSIASLLSVPVRYSEGFSQHKPLARTELLGQFRRSPSPHSLILGASGQGKTTLNVHLIDDALERGETPLVIDGQDGHLAATVLERAETHGREPVVADFSTPQSPTVALTLPPDGINPLQWVSELYEMIRTLLWGDMPSEFFGPVGERAVRLVLEVLVRAGLSIADAGRVIDPEEGRWRADVLDAIGDPLLSRGILREVMPLVTDRNSGNSALFVSGKFDPLIGNGYLRNLFCAETDTLGIEGALIDGRPYVLSVPPATLGDVGSRVIVGLTVLRAWLHVQRQRPSAPVSIFIDEFQKYPVPVLTSLLTESRKFGVRLFLATQTLETIPPPLRETVLSNVGCLATFRTGPKDSAFLDSSFPTVPAGLLQRLAPHHVAITTGDSDLITPALRPLS